MLVKIYYKGEIVEVEGNYIKGEPREYDYPGSADEFEIEAVIFNEIDIFVFVEDDLYEIERRVIQKIKD